MKNIIVPTDFSPCATNALRYAIDLALITKAKMHVIYVHNLIIMSQAMYVENDLPTIIPIPIPEKDLQLMNDLKNKLAGYQGFEYECLIKDGMLDEVLVEFARKETEALIVMGTAGAHDKISLGAGSNTAKIIGRKDVAILSVPEQFRGTIHSQCEMIFATDFEMAGDWSAMNPFYELAKLLNAKINVFYVRKDENEQDMSSYEKETFDDLITFFNGVHVSLHHTVRDNIVTSIDEFAQIKNSPLVAMVTHERGWLEELFHHSITKDMALHGHVPLMTMPYENVEINQSNNAGYW